jgi:hypothetical protein
MSGVREGLTKQDTELRFVGLAEKLGQTRVLTEEIYHEVNDPLLGLDGASDHDLEVLKTHLANDSLGKPTLTNDTDVKEY